jgi:hypothetical protein
MIQQNFFKSLISKQDMLLSPKKAHAIFWKGERGEIERCKAVE